MVTKTPPPSWPPPVCACAVAYVAPGPPCIVASAKHAAGIERLNWISPPGDGPVVTHPIKRAVGPGGDQWPWPLTCA